MVSSKRPNFLFPSSQFPMYKDKGLLQPKFPIAHSQLSRFTFLPLLQGISLVPFDNVEVIANAKLKAIRPSVKSEAPQHLKRPLMVGDAWEIIGRGGKHGEKHDY